MAADDSRLPDTWSPSNNIVWRREVPGWSWSSPVVWGDHVFVASVIDTADRDPSQPASAYAARAAGGPMTFKDLSASKGEHRWVLYDIDVATGRPVAVLSSFTMSLMASFLLGADGAISGMGSVVADLQADLFAACRKGDLDEARRINDRLDPLVRVFYAPPFVDMHNRMKEALAMLGRIPAAHVRPPLTPIPEAERRAIRAALDRARL